MSRTGSTLGWGTTTTHLEGLLAEIRQGDQTKVDELVRVAWPKVEGLARAIVHGQSRLAGLGVTDDVCAEAYVKFAQRLREGMARPFEGVGQMLAYLAKTVRHAAIDEVERRSGPKFQAQFPRASIVSEPAAANPQDDLVGRLTYYQMIDTLGEDERPVVDCYTALEMSLDEIAAHLGQSRRWVTKRLGVGLRQLQKQFQDIQD